MIANKQAQCKGFFWGRGGVSTRKTYEKHKNGQTIWTMYKNLY